MALRFFTVTLSFTLLSCLTPCAQAISETGQNEPEYLNLSLGMGLEYSSGDYGTDETIDTWKIPFIVEWTPLNRLSLSLEIPYVYQNNSGGTVLLGRNSTPMPPGSGQNSGNGSDEPTSTLEQLDKTEKGLGDIILDTAFTLLKQKDNAPRLLALFYAKLPTADEQKGLGTGEFDWGAGLGIGKKVGKWSIYSEALAILPGSSDTYDPDAYWDWLISLSHRTGSSLQTGLSLSGGTAAFDGADTPLEAKIRFGGISGDRTSFGGYISKGLSDASPDWGVGIFGYLDF